MKKLTQIEIEKINPKLSDYVKKMIILGKKPDKFTMVSCLRDIDFYKYMFWYEASTLQEIKKEFNSIFNTNV